MPLNGKANPVSKPSWLKETAPATTTTTTTNARPSWARKTPEAKTEDSAKVVKKEEPPKKEVSTRLQSREIKVPFKVEKTIPTQSILKKPDVKIKQDLKEEHQTVSLRDTKLGSKSPSTTPSKSPSTTPSKSTSTTPRTTPSKSPSKTPDYDSDEDESSYETETDSSEETDSDEDYSDDEKPSYKPPSPGVVKKQLAMPALKKPAKSPEKSEKAERPSSPDYTFKNQN